MAQALSTVVIGGMSVKEAARHFGVPKSILSDRVSVRIQSRATSGSQTYLKADKEADSELVQFLV